MNTVKTGGGHAYLYDTGTVYKSHALAELSDKIVTTSKRDPKEGTLKALFGKNQRPLRRIGIIIFESQIQSTRDGLAGKNEVYVSEQGKQILTENMLRIWEQSLKVLAPELEFVPTTEIKKTSAFHEYGSPEEDFINSGRTSIAPDDVFYLGPGKKTTTTSVVNPRHMRDMSFLLVPATELMGGPKWSEHNKHFVNDVAKSLKLDAVIIVMSEASWTAAHTDKHSGENVPEEITVKIKASTLVPLSQYHERLEKLGNNQKPNVTLCYRSYEAMMKSPAEIAVPEDQKNFETIENEIIAPMFKTYKDLSQMTLIRIVDDIKKTW
jgi:hypothetical protein